MNVQMSAHKGPKVLRQAQFDLTDPRSSAIAQQLIREWIVLGHRVVISRQDLPITSIAGAIP